VNVANLLLVRAEARSADSAIRMALGANRAQLLRQALTETLLLAFFGGALGLAVAAAGLRFLIRIAPADIPRLDEVRLDGGVLWFALALTTLTGLIFGLAPAWRTASNDPQNALKSRGRTLAGAGSRLRTALIIAESGLSAALLILAGLLLTSFSRLIRVEKGFSAPTVLAAEITIPKAKYQKAEQQNDFFERVVARRMNEIGIRTALGARPGHLVWMVLRQGLTPVVLGLLGGTAVALAMSRVLGSLLYEVRPYDPATLAAVALILLLTAVFACLLPARRATRVSPVDALRAE
jgi:ABC-type antimicrobial peptide transport system permease subunit